MESRNTDTNTSVFRSLDWVSVCLYLVMVVAGVFSIYAASYNLDSPVSIFDFSGFAGKQFTWVCLSLVLGCVILLMDYRLYEAYAYPIYGAVIMLLLLTIFVAHDVHGSRSWIVMGPVSIQPAEFGKFATALALARLFSSYGFVLNQSASNYYKALIIIFLPIILILMQKETGSALVYFSLIIVLYREGMSGLVLLFMVCMVAFFVVALKYSTGLFMGMTVGEFSVLVMIMLIMVAMVAFYCDDIIAARNLFLGLLGAGVLAVVLDLCGVSMNGMVYFISAIGAGCVYICIAMFRHRLGKYLITLGFVLVSVLFLLSVNYVLNDVLQKHQQQRVMVSLGIIDDPHGTGYNVKQSIIAVGSGGLTGKGYLNGTQTKLKYVPEQHTDFIYSTVGEEWGFVGSVAVLVVFAALILRVVAIAERQRTAFGRVYGYCVASYLGFHLMVNVGMVIGLCPVIGIPLPFFSYGGSALWSFTILLFILLRIDAARKERRD